jgi:hypothetical protein
VNAPLEARIRERLRQIQAVTLQKLAEDLACIKFPERFGAGLLRRAGRNDEDQTTKGWPDAYVITDTGTVDGVEATRQKHTWEEHLRDDLRKARDPEYKTLSGYVFVGGYPSHKPLEREVDEWTERFAAAGLQHDRINLFIGEDLVFELCNPRYAGIRHRYLGIVANPTWFRLLGDAPLTDKRFGLFQPTKEEFEGKLVPTPRVLEQVLDGMERHGSVLVRGYGASGKTTLAELIARHDRVAPNAVWYADTARANAEDVEAAVLNEMIELAGCGVLIVVDNAHLDAGFAARVRDFWSRHLKPMQTRLLMLERKTQESDRRECKAAPVYELRAGIDEMLAVVKRLSSREACILDKPPEDATKSWARTFGGSDHPDFTAVDLIAFTAAVDRRLSDFAHGDFRLSAADAVEAVRARYLRPLQSNGEMQNVLRLAALAEFEIGVSDDQLAEPLAGLSHSVNDYGIVVYEAVGLEHRRLYRLVHAAVGPLLLAAVAGNFDSREDRLSAVGQSPGLGLRMAANLKRTDRGKPEAETLQRKVKDALRQDGWSRRARDFYDLANLARYGVREGLATEQRVDDEIAKSGTINRLIGHSPALAAVNQFLSAAKRLQLDVSIAMLGELAQTGPLREMLPASRPGDVTSFLRGHPQGRQILASIDEPRWTRSQRGVSPQLASITTSVCRFFAAECRAELAIAPARRQVKALDPKLWYNRDLSHLSHILRFARSPVADSRQLLEMLASSGWLADTYRGGAVGQLCGALMSLANYLDKDLRPLVLSQELADRVSSELAQPFVELERRASRPVCLLGGFDILGGRLPTTPQIDWSADPKAVRVLKDVAHSGTTGEIGMYELQLWFGLKALHQNHAAPRSLPRVRSEDFLFRLARVTPPTPTAASTQTELLVWLEQLKAADWTLYR